jgi:hypothetical protein
MRHDYYHCVHPVPQLENCNVRGDETNLQGLSGGQTAERVDAVSVVVGATNMLGCY